MNQKEKSGFEIGIYTLAYIGPDHQLSLDNRVQLNNINKVYEKKEAS